MTTKYYGKYRGTVENNIDPLFLGRVQVKVPSVLGEGTLAWATPCVPFAGNQVGFFAIPPNHTNIWVEFEEGDITRPPIWSGCFWGIGEVPAMPPIAEMKVIKTDTGTITINDLPGVGGITIETNYGAKIAITMLGIEISNGLGSIKIEGPKVSINGTALEVI